MGALDGVRVVDVTHFEAGAVCTLLLAWLGADVVKVEPPGGEQGRRATGGDRWPFLLVNANKRSVTLNLKTEQGRQLMQRLVERADVLVENWAPGVAERLSLSETEVFAVNPRIVYARIKGFPRGSRYGAFPAFDPVGQAVGGLASMTGQPDGSPLRAGGNVADSGAGLHAALGVVAALYQRTRTGSGQLVEVSLQGSVMGLCRAAWTWVNRNRTGTPRVGNEMAMAQVAPAGAYPCKPGGPNDYVFLYTSRWPESDQWARLCSVIGREDWVHDPRFQSPQDRYEHRHLIDQGIADWTRQRTKQQAMEELGRAGVPAGAVFGTDELAADPELRRAGLVAEVEEPEGGKVVMVGLPVRLSASEVVYRRAPRLGEHNEEIYGELGLTMSELEALRRAGVI